MKKRLFRSLLLLTSIGVVLALAICLLLTFRHTENAGYTALEEEARLVRELVRNDEKGAGLKNLALSDRITLLDAEGNVIFDSYADAATMGNHLDRPEVQQAIAEGEGRSQRSSATLGKGILYYALALPDGRILRIARTDDMLYSQARLLVANLIILGLVLMAGAYFAARKITKEALAPLEELDFDNPPAKCLYPELKPVLKYFASQQQKLEKGIRRYKNKKQELKTLSNNMDEGMLFLTRSWVIVSMNKSASKFFGRDKQDILHKSFLDFDPGEEVRDLFKELETSGKGRRMIARGNYYYQLNGSRVADKGYILLIMDVTERAASEKLRREFSANVSHELKTPLQSVMGYSEIMLSGLVKPEDSPRFLKKIYEEAQKLLRLIDDIIKLSKLDELERDMLEEFTLQEAAESVIARLRDKAAKLNVEIRFENKTLRPSVMLGIPSLMEEVFFNLLDNSIKYNRPGGSVTLKITENGSKYNVSVADTGIGIPSSELPHIFERFYRVDRSRNKGIEGTGLGLSIVKHGVMYHRGTVKVLSTLGEGTEFIMKFPKGADSLIEDKDINSKKIL